MSQFPIGTPISLLVTTTSMLDVGDVVGDLARLLPGVTLPSTKFMAVASCLSCNQVPYLISENCPTDKTHSPTH